MTRGVVIAYHGRCFDGVCSAALLTHVLRALQPGLAEPAYVGLHHQPGGSHVPEAVLSGELNAVVDFRYTTSERLSWWFDHHLTGVVGEQERAHLARDRSGHKFFDPSYGSCCRLIADVARSRLGVRVDALAEMIHWAQVIDTAGFPDARTAVALELPALRLMTVIEAYGEDAFVTPRIARLAAGAKLSELVEDPEVEDLFAPLAREQQRTVEAIAREGRCERGVVSFDLSASGRERFNKLIPYALHPGARYAVGVSAGPRRAKVSVGSNPWSSAAQPHDIAAICARFGGGGHHDVGAVSLQPTEVALARRIAAQIAAELAG